MSKILSLVLFLLIWTSAVGQQQDFYDSNYSDNDARWVNNNNIREKRTFEVTVSEKGDSVLELRNLTAYNLSGNISFVREFLDSDTTTYDEVINRYENNVVIETIAIMKDPYDDIKTTYKYHSDKLVMMCDYSRISPSDKYILDSRPFQTRINTSCTISLASSSLPKNFRANRKSLFLTGKTRF